MFLRMFTLTLLKLGYRVIVFCAEPEQLRQHVLESDPERIASLYVQHMPEPNINIVGIPTKIAMQFRVISAWKLTLKVIKQFEKSDGIYPDFVFFPWLDSFLHPLLFPFLIENFFPYQWSGLYFHPRHLRLNTRIATVIKFLKPEKVLQATNCIGVAVLDEGIQQQLMTRLSRKSVILFPDVTETQIKKYVVAEKVKELAQGRIVVSLLEFSRNERAF